MKYYAVSNKGLMMDRNEDALALPKRAIQEADTEYEEIEVSEGVFAVLDGVGGTEHGDWASLCGAEILSLSSPPSTEDELRELIYSVNETIVEKYNNLEIATASTVAGVVSNGETTFVFNVGDSKAYAINNGYFEELSKGDDVFSVASRFSVDDSFETRMNKSPLLQFLGDPSGKMSPHILKLAIPKSVFVCTDGVSDLINVDELEEIYGSSNNDGNMFCEKIRQTVLRKGAHDNFSYIFIDFSEVR